MARRPPTPPKKCIFCGRRAGEVKITGEHIWPDWLRPYIPRMLLPTGHTVSLTTVDGISHNVTRHQQGRGILHGPGDPHSKRLRIVCKKCNEIWMSQLQARAKKFLVPLIKGEWPDLTVEDQKTLAAWATMFTMVVEFADPNTLATPFADRDQFRRTQEPPAGWYVWMGAFEGKLWRGVFNHFGWQTAVLPTVALPPKLDAQCTAFVLGRVFFQTFSTTRPRVKVQELAFAERFGIRTLWPTSNAAVVRPKHVLNDVEADFVSSALQPAPRHRIRRAWQAG